MVQRELLVASRRVATYRLRVLVALVAFILGLAFLVFWRRSPAEMGGVLFQFLTWGAFALCLFEGIYGTADTLAEGRREGTLGLLFLTDLRAHDIVLGKFVGGAIRSGSILFAAFPVFAFPLLIGGVTGGEFWRVSLALGVTLLVSLSAGIFCSAVARSGLAAMAGTALCLAVLVAVPPIVEAMLARHGIQNSIPMRLIGGPLGGLLQAFDYPFRREPVTYWVALSGAALTTAILLVLGSVLLSRNWRESGESGLGKGWQWLIRPRVKSRAVVIENPSQWLAERTLPGQRLIWMVVGTSAAAAFLVALKVGMDGVGVVIALQIGVCFLLKLWLAVLAPQSLNESRRSGALELLLVTGISPGELEAGQVDTLIKYFVRPALLATAGISFLSLPAAYIGSEQRATDGLAMAVSFSFGCFLFFVLDFYAISRVGLWLGLTQVRPGHAVAKTILWVMVVPWLTLILPLIGCLGLVGWPVFWIIWASSRLSRRFREEVARPLGTETGGETWWRLGSRKSG